METVRPAGPPPEVYITEELWRRAPRRADAQREKQAILELAALMAEQPERVLPRFVDLAMELTEGSSSGLSILHEAPAPGVFRWRHLRGVLAPFEDSAVPRDSSPSAVTLDSGAAVLARHPERVFGWLAEGRVELPEILLVPLDLGGEMPRATLWVVGRDTGHFDAGDARGLTEMARFVGHAMRMVRAEGRLHRALADQEMQARAVNQRIANLFADIDRIMRLSARISGTKDALAEKLSGRMEALGLVHALFRRGLPGAAGTALDLRMLAEQVLRPHEKPVPGEPQRITWSGPPVRCGEEAAIGLALVLHELAANAVGHGALASSEGRVTITWRLQGSQLALCWTEEGGGSIVAAPRTQGSGSVLMQDTVIHRLMGTLEQDWRPQGLEVAITLPLANLAI